MNFFYHIYGLTIKSSRRVNILTEKKSTSTDLTVQWTTDSKQTPENELVWEQLFTRELSVRDQITFFCAPVAAGTFYKICFKTEYGGLFFILHPDKTKLWIIASEDEPAANLDSYFVGSIIGCVLRLMGKLCLHSSVINIHDKAVLFVGSKRSGKSTTAAAFAKMGFKVLSDDIAVLTLKENTFYVEPGYSKVRLRPQSLAALHHESPESFDAVYTTRDSRYADIRDSFYEKALPLGAVYILNRNDTQNTQPYIEPVCVAALVQIHTNTFANYIITGNMRRHEFELAAHVANYTVVRQLHFGNNVQLVKMQCEAVINDFATIEKSKVLTV